MSVGKYETGTPTSVTWWLTAHAVPRIGFVVVAALAILVLPPGGASATPSPAGATLAVACFVALVSPVVAAWGCSRGDARLEAVASRPIVAMNLALMLIRVGAFAIGALALAGLGVAGSGRIAGRDALTYAGLALVVQPWAGWRNASIAPVVYLLAVAILGRGADIAHPAVGPGSLPTARTAPRGRSAFSCLSRGLSPTSRSPHAPD
jgi:hypothetical protein